VTGHVNKDWDRVAQIIGAIEKGRRLARDVGGPDPERMTPRNFVAYVVQTFKSHGLDKFCKFEVIDDLNVINKEYPLVSAVARASTMVPRHAPAILNMEYIGSGKIEETLLLAGKGIVYDTGGIDVKTGGAMVGMSRDKCGAAAIAGLILSVCLLQPASLRIVGSLALVRNSCGADSYVADEIIKSHAGVRVKVGNSDAEGRMVLGDILSHLRVRALSSVNPRLMTIATLTGHASRAVGYYSIILDNGPAKSLDQSHSLQLVSHQWGDPFEISNIRHDDYNFIQAKKSDYDVLQCNPMPSSVTKRGHQYPAAFIITASGLHQHGNDSEKPLPFSHIDIAGSACEEDDCQFGKPTATPLVALMARYVLPKIVGEGVRAKL